MRFTVPAAAFAAVIAAASTAHAQEPPDTFRLKEVVVTATRLPTPAAAVPGTVTVITGAELRERGVRFVADALRQVPGVAVMQLAGPGSQTSVFMRGGESDYVQVLVDGVQLNQPGGAFNWADLRTEDIERIEIVRGPASVLYGSDAVAGVVQIFTRAGGPPRIDAGVSSGRGSKHLGGGAFVTNAFDASLAGAVPLDGGRARLRYGVAGAHLASNGLFPRHSDYDNTTFTGRLQYAGPGADAALTARRGDNEFHYPTTGSGALVERDQFALGETLSLALDAGVRPHQRVELRMLATSHTSDERTENPPTPAADGSFWSTNEIARRKLDGRANIALSAATTLTVGGERQWQSAATAFESVHGFGTFADSSDESRTSAAVYAQLHGASARGFAATLGGRIDDSDAFGTFRTARAALNWTPRPGARLHAAFGTAFKEPTFFETYAQGFTRGNPELQPEQTRSGEVGVEAGAAGGTLVAGATWFHQRFRNLIQYTFVSNDAPNYFNIGAARAYGAELFVRGEHARLGYRAAYTLTRTRVADEGFGTDVAFQQDQPLLRRPVHQFTASADVRINETLRAGADLRRIGSRDDLDFTDPEQWDGIRTRLPAHTAIDLFAGYSLLRRAGYDVDITARVRNATDTRYQEIYNFQAPGRVFQIGARIGRGM